MRFPSGYEFFQLGHHSKKPIAEGSWRDVPSLTTDEARAILGQGGNYAVRLRNTDFVIDVDPRNGGNPDTLGIDWRKCPIVLTPSGGMHLYFTKPADLKLRHTVKAFPGIDFCREGHYVVGPGSIHPDFPDGPAYQFDTLFGSDFPAPPLPDIIIARLKIQESETTGGGEWSVAQGKSALDQLDPADFAAHDEWFAVMCAAHEAMGGAGCEEFVEWSARNPQFAHLSNEVRYRWNTLQAGKAGNAGAGTLMHLLVQKGVTIFERDDAVAEFEGMGEEDNGDEGGTTESSSDVQRRLETTGNSAGGNQSKNPENQRGNGEDSKDSAGSNRKSKTAELNQRFYVVQEDGKLRILEIRKRDDTGVLHWIRHSKADFLEVAQSVYHYPMIAVTNKDSGKVTQTALAKLWIEKQVPGKKVFPGGVCFAPEHNVERVGDSLNLWRGFAFKPDPLAGEWTLLEEMVLNILCRGDKASFEYVLNWMARAVQLPHKPAGTAVVFKGTKGTGKGTLARTFVKLFGTHGLHITSMESLTGRFNSHLEDCVAMFADEAYWAGDRAAEGAFQALITEPTKHYEAKGLTPKTGRNCIHIMMSSNRDYVVPAGMDGERRFGVFEVSEEVRPAEFWDRLNAQLEDGGYQTLLFDLLHRDIQSFRPQNIPQTQALSQQKIEAMDYVEQWLFALLDSENWNGLPVIEDGDVQYILAHDFQNNFLQYLNGRRTVRSIETQVGMNFRKFIPSMTRHRLNRPEHRIDLTTVRPWAYRLPDLHTAQKGFIKAVGYNVFAEPTQLDLTFA